jgi:outer membrane protein assembly factor BamB
MVFELLRNNQRLNGFIEFPLKHDEIAIDSGSGAVNMPETLFGNYYISNDDTLFCFDIKTRKLLWEKNLDWEPYTNTVDHNANEFFAFLSGGISCLERDSFKNVWFVEANEYVMMVAEDHLICKDFIKESIVCRKKENGALQWERNEFYGSVNTIAKENDILVARGSEGLHVLVAKTGQEIWGKRLEWFFEQCFPGQPFDEFTMGPLIDGILYVAYKCQGGKKVGAVIIAIDVKSGELVWDTKLEQVVRPGTMIHCNGRLYYDLNQSWGRENFLSCVDALTGELLFQTEENFSPSGCANPIIVGKYFIGGYGRYLSFFDLEEEKFVYRYKHKRNEKVFGGALCVHEDTIIAYNNNPNKIYWFRGSSSS